MKGDLKKILSIIWKGRKLKIGYMNKYLVISVDEFKFDNKNGELDLEEISEMTGESPRRCTREARVFSETIHILDDLTEMGFHTSITYKKKKSLKIKVELGSDSYAYEVIDVDRHSYSCFISKLVKVNKDLKKIVL